MQSAACAKLASPSTHGIQSNMSYQGGMMTAWSLDCRFCIKMFFS